MNWRKGPDVGTLPFRFPPLMTDAAPASGFSRRWLWFLGAVVGGVVLVALFLRVNLTPSVATGVYLRVPEALAPGEPAVGDLVMGCIPPGAASQTALERAYLRRTRTGCASGVVPVTKRVRAVGGQTVRVSDEGVWVDGVQASGTPRTQDRLGRPLAPAYGTWPIGPGEVWASSDVENGFDSRYFGPIRPTARAWLLLAF